MKRTIVFFIVFFFMSLNGFSQEKSQLRFNSLGLKIGWYNPSLDYWKNESEFKNADFNGGFCYNVFGDLSIIKNALGKWNMGVWQSSVEDNIQGFGLTTWTLTGMTASFDLTYQAKQITFYRITPYIGAGGEFIYLEQKLKFENKEFLLLLMVQL